MKWRLKICFRSDYKKWNSILQSKVFGWIGTLQLILRRLDSQIRINNDVRSTIDWLQVGDLERKLPSGDHLTLLGCGEKTLKLGKHPKLPFWQGKCMNTMMRKSLETFQQNQLKSGCYSRFLNRLYDSSDEDMAEQQGNGGNEVLRTRTKHLWNTSESPHYYHLPI